MKASPRTTDFSVFRVTLYRLKHVLQNVGSFSSSTVIINAGGALIVKYKELGAKKTVNSLEKQIFQLGNLEKKIESILDWLQSIFLQKNGKRNDLSLTGFKWQCKSMQELKFKDSGRQFEQNRDR